MSDIKQTKLTLTVDQIMQALRKLELPDFVVLRAAAVLCVEAGVDHELHIDPQVALGPNAQTGDEVQALREGGSPTPLPVAE